MKVVVESGVLPDPAARTRLGPPASKTRPGFITIAQRAPTPIPITSRFLFWSRFGDGNKAPAESSRPGCQTETQPNFLVPYRAGIVSDRLEFTRRLYGA